MLDEIKNDADLRMQKSIDVLSQELAKIRTGRAHPDLLKGIKVDYYGQMTPIEQVASVVVADPRTLSVTPFEKSMVQVVDKAIMTSDLGVNPVTAGNVIRIPLPPLTEERRKTLVKQVKAEGESAKVAVRNIRRDANGSIKELLKAKEISEDEERKTQDEVQKMTNQFISKVDEAVSVKENDLMQV